MLSTTFEAGMLAARPCRGRSTPLCVDEPLSGASRVFQPATRCAGRKAQFDEVHRRSTMLVWNQLERLVREPGAGV